jgi:pimeloyl-ACP methyl ester carboxylesterase
MREEAGHGAALAFEEAGEGTPVLLLHGFPFNRDLFAPVLPALAQVAKVVACDLPGFGASPPLPPGFSLADMARKVLAWAQEKELSPFVLVGHSMGGYVALEVAAQAPSSLLGLVLLASHANADSPEAYARRQEGIAWLQAGQRQKFLLDFLRRLVGRTTQERFPRLLQELEAMTSAVPDQVLAGCLQAMALRRDHRQTLAQLPVPLLVLVGEEDPLISQEVAAATAALAPQGQLALVPQAGHLPTLEMPVATAEILARFCRRLES